MYDVLALISTALVVFVPGLVLARILGAQGLVLPMAVAPGVSVAAAGLLAMVAAALGFNFGAVSYGIMTLLLVAALIAVETGRRGRYPRARLSWSPAMLIGGVLVVGGVAFSSWSWLHGIGGLETVPQEHDMIIHAMQTAYIARSGHGAPWELMPADVLTGASVSFYPSGLHLLAAVSSDFIGSNVVALNAITVVFLSGVLGTGCAALTWVAARNLRMERGRACLAAGMASLVVAGLYRPAFHLMHDGGILGNAAALALVPGIAASVLLLASHRWFVGTAVGGGAAGAVWVHPSALVSIALTVGAWWVGDLLVPAGRSRFKAALRPNLAFLGTAGLVAAPTVLIGLVAAGRTSGFPPDTSPVSLRDALGSTFGFPYAGWINQAQSAAQFWVVVLVFVGVTAIISVGRAYGPVVAWLFWSLVILGEWLSPGVGPESAITGFFYNAMLRVWSHVSLIAPTLAAVGVVLAVSRISILVRRVVPIRSALLAAAGVVLVYAWYATGPAASYAKTAELAVATRYSTPDFVRVGPDDQAAIAWLADHVKPGERVFNSPNDGSTYLYVERGVPVVNVYTLGLPGVPYSYSLLEDFNKYPSDESVRRLLIDLNVRWVYVDSSAPGIGSAGSPDGWAGDGGFSQAPGLSSLAGLPGLQVAFVSGTVTVYSLDLLAMDQPVTG